MLNPAARNRPGPLERTAAELEHLRRLHAFRRTRELRSRRQLRESDLLLDLVEQCRLRGYRLVPAQLWTHIVRFVAALDHGLVDEIGINRGPDRVGDVLFDAQDELLRRAAEERRPGVAPIIPLFPDEVSTQTATSA